MRPTELFASALLFGSLSSAWPSAWNAARLLQNEIEPLVRRQDQQPSSSQFDLSYTGRQGNTATTVASTDSGDSTATATGDSSQQTDDSDSATGTDSATGSEMTSGTARQTGSQTGTRTSGANAETRTFDARLPAGGVSMITPNAMTSSYFKINNFVTFAWNYTSLSVTPSYIDILASCSRNQATYTIAMNQSVEPTQSIIWDTGAYQASNTLQLLTETYTLIIHDAAKDVTARASPGYLGTYNQFTFGMYLPQSYTPIADYVCATCNSALSLAERQTLWAIFGMVGLTVLSFGWFTGVAGLW